MIDAEVELSIGLVGDDHILSLFNIQSDEMLNHKFQMIAPEEWRNAMHLKVRNYGVAGDCTADLLAKMEGDFFNQAPDFDYLVLLIGTNDVLLNTLVPDIVQNLRAMLKIVQDHEITPVFCTLLPMSREDYSPIITDINSMMTLYCADKGIKVLDLNIAFNDGEDHLNQFYDVGDGIHLTQDGYMFLADNLLLRVREILGSELEDYLAAAEPED
jgi:lysophospholipase L1-like esterase